MVLIAERYAFVRNLKTNDKFQILDSDLLVEARVN